MLNIDDDHVYTAARARLEALRAHPDVQQILAAAATADAATIRRLHIAWLDNFRVARIEHLRIWHVFVKAYGEHWRDVLMLGYDAERMMAEHPDTCWGAAHAVADAVKAVHMAGHCPNDGLRYAYTRPWRTVMAFPSTPTV